MRAYQKVSCGDFIIFLNIGQNTHHDKRDNTTVHKEKPKTTTAWQQHVITKHGSKTTKHQHGSNTTWQQHNMVQTLLGTDNSTKDKKVETTIHHAKHPQLST
jgi:hypothetical protein